MLPSTATYTPIVINMTYILELLLNNLKFLEHFHQISKAKTTV